MSATPAELSLRGRIGAYESWANTPDRSKRTAPARAALDKKFLDQASGDPERAAQLRKAYFARLALKSARARRRIKEASAELAEADAEIATLGGDAA